MANLLSTNVSGRLYVSTQSDVNSTGGAFRFYDGSTFRGGLGLDDWAHGGSAANITMYVNGDNNFFISTSGVKRAQFNSGAAIFRTYSPDTNYNIRVTGGDQFNAYYGDNATTMYVNWNGGTTRFGGEGRFNGSLYSSGYVWAENANIRIGEIWGLGGLYRSSGSMLFGVEGGAGWSFRAGNSEKVWIGNDGNIYMAWAGAYISTLLDAKQNASTAITTSNIGSQSVNYATTAGSAPANGGTSTHTYRGIIEDTRAAQRSPSAYDDYRVSWEFTNQMPHDSNWLTIMTMQGWHDGYAAWQIMGTATTTAYENWYLRSGVNGTWNPARTIIHSGNISSQSVSYATSAGDSTNLDGRSSSRYLYYRGVSSSGDFQSFQSSESIIRFDQVNDYNGLSNPPGGYTYGGVLSMRGDNFGFQLWGSHTGNFYFKTQWNNDQYSGWREVIHSANIGSYALTSLPSHNHDDRYLVKGGGWYGSGLPGSRWGGFSVSGGEIVFGDGLPNAGQMGILIDGAYLAGENNGFWSLASDNSWSSRRGMYWDGSNLNFTANSPTALFNSIRLSTSTNNGTISGGGDWGIRFANDNGWIQFGPANNSWTHIYSDKNFYMNTHLWVSGGYKVTAWDYNNGGGALYATVFYDANDTGYYVDPNSTSYLYHLVLSGNSYFRPNTWIQFDGNYGVYWPNHYGLHLYPNTDGSYGSLQVKGIKNSWHGIHFDSGSTLMMNSGETGVHRQGVGWQWRWYNGEMYISAGSTGGGTERTVIHSGNIGSQSVSYATSAGSVAWSNVSSKPATWLNEPNLIQGSEPDTIRTSGFFESYQGSGNPTGTWMNYINVRHSNTNNGHGFQIGMSYYDNNLWFRSYSGNIPPSFQSWSRALGTNTDPYPSNMNQYVRTTDDVTHNSTTSPTFLVNNHSDNTKGYRIHNTSGSSVSAMFTNSSNQLVIAAGAVDQINLNKKVYVNGVALGVNVAPSATAGRIDASNDIVAYSSSDERLKYNIAPIENALGKVKSLTGVEFDWKPEYKHAHGYEGHDTGIIAQQVEAVMPSAVRTNDTGFLAVRYEKLIGLLIEGMKEQQAQIDELKAKLDGLTK